MKKVCKIGFILLFPLVLGLCACGIFSHRNTGGETSAGDDSESEGALDIQTDTAEDYPRIAYIGNTTYYGTGEKCEVVPRKMPDGIIETFVPKEIMPDAYDSANFGAEYGKLEFMFLEDERLIIHIGEDWYYFEK